MQRFAMMLALTAVCGAGTAFAQTSPGAADRGYVEFSAGPTFANKVSASFGAEGGYRIADMLDLFVEGGRMQDTATKDLRGAATTIAGFLSRVSGRSASFTAKQPVTYFAVGLRYGFPTGGRFTPYGAFAGGAAKVERNTTFQLNGIDVTASLLDTYGVQLGGDLSDSFTKALVTVGVGTEIKLPGRLIGDVSYRYGRIFAPDAGVNTNRLQLGIGTRF